MANLAGSDDGAAHRGPHSTTVVSAGNLFRHFRSPTSHTDTGAPKEEIQTLVRDGSTIVEKIISIGGVISGDWYDQDTVEFVVLLSGSASLLFEGDPEPTPLNPGDYLCIPKHKRHKVTSTSKDVPAVWLAFHWK